MALIRGAIEVTALVVGAVLGGTLGPGTLAFALLIGPVVALSLRILDPGRRAAAGVGGG